MSAAVVHQRVYRNKGNHRCIGVVTEVLPDNWVRVLWSEASKPSRKIVYSGLTVVSIQVNATVVRGTSSRQLINPQYPLFGSVTEVAVRNIRQDHDIGVNSGGNEVCTVTWDDRTETTLPVQEVMDINWLQPVPLGDLPLKDWLKTFAMTHNIDLTSVRPGTYRCSRNHHATDCQCHSDLRKKGTHHVLASCMCRFQITVFNDNTVQFSGTHAHHIPGKSIYNLSQTYFKPVNNMLPTCYQHVTN